MTALTVPFDLIPPRPVRWFHEGFVPFKHVTIVLGPAGTSKGITVLDYGARMTRHAPAPGEPHPRYGGPRDIVVVLPEDDANESVAWRLKSAGAITDRVHNLTVFPDGHHFSVPADIALLPQAIAEIEYDLDEQGNRTVPRFAADGKRRKVGMVILDPLLALAEKDLRTRGQARPIMEALEDMAKALRLVILLTHHTNANGQAASSRAIIETVRNVLTLSKPAKAADDSPARVLTVAKTNIGMTGVQLRYTLAGTYQEPVIEWECEQPAGDVAADKRGYDVAKEPAKPTLQQQAAQLGCKHASTRFGNPAQCKDCPAAKLIVKPKPAVPAPGQTPPTSPPGPVTPLPVLLTPEPKTGFRDLRRWKRTAA